MFEKLVQLKNRYVTVYIVHFLYALNCIVFASFFVFNKSFSKKKKDQKILTTKFFYIFDFK